MLCQAMPFGHSSFKVVQVSTTSVVKQLMDVGNTASQYHLSLFVVIGHLFHSNVLHFQIHAIATLTHIVMPTLFPRCAKFYEVGNYFLHGDTRAKLLEVSPDGLIR